MSLNVIKSMRLGMGWCECVVWFDLSTCNDFA